MTASRGIVVTMAAFLVTGLTYVLILGTCLGSEQGTALAAACSAIGPAIKAPFLYIAPFLHSKYLGVDSSLILVAVNSICWGLGAAGLVHFATRGRVSKAD